MIVLFEPLIDDSWGLAGGAKPFSVENLSAKGSVEALVVAVLPGRPGIDPDWLDSDFGQPICEGFGRELRAIIGAQIFRFPSFEQ